MRKRRATQSLKVVTALERGHNPTFRVGVGDRDDGPCGPIEILGFQGLLRLGGIGPAQDQERIGEPGQEVPDPGGLFLQGLDQEYPEEGGAIS